MNLQLVERIANAVLYEGYMLYPYRPSAVKNQQRWNFGALYPRNYSEAQAPHTDAWSMQTECLVHGDERSVLDVKVRFLHLLAREVGVPVAECGMRIANCDDEELQDSISDSDFRAVGSLEVGEQVFHSWQESVERGVSASSSTLRELVAQPQERRFSFDSSRTIEPLRDSNGLIVGILVRKQQAIEGAIEIRIADCRLLIDETQRLVSNQQSAISNQRLFKVTVRILNLTPFDETKTDNRDAALMRALVSTHTILSVRDGEFISLLDPPEAFREHAAACSNVGTWPVMVGEEGARDCMLSSPIILYDYPQIAPESAGDLFDGTEIDEILTLRIMTLTDEEKREMRSSDERARQILERTETMPPEQLMKLHGVVRSLRPSGEGETGK
ncbi:MAG TPA: hypothetical protein VK619_07275 [Pyrinomonadaceae bacterium]|nr:hypothetical protein [Pyrinomonadaceae bacterium]